MKSSPNPLATLAGALSLVFVLAFPAHAQSTADGAPVERRVLGLSADQPMARNARPEVVARLESLRERAAAGPVRVIVGVRAPFAPEGVLTAAAVRGQRASIALAQEAALVRLPQALAARAYRHRSVPFLVMDVDASQLEALAAMPEVTDIQEDMLLQGTLAQSVPLVRANESWAAGAAGADWAVAVLDNGVLNTHPFVRQAIVSEACYSTHAPDQGYFSLCPGYLEGSTAAGAASNCTSPVFGKWACRHGTHVAGIAAGDGRDAGQSFSGVARDAGIVAIQVFSWLAPRASTFAFLSDINRGLERVLELKDGGMQIAAASLSVGGDVFTTPCDAELASTKALIDTLRSREVATVIASGNNGRTNGVTLPGCISSAVTVGATWDAVVGTKGEVDKVANFSNNAGFVDLLAPGASILSSVPATTYTNAAGTSMATPHVSGCWTLLKSASPGATVSQIEAALELTGKPIADYRKPALVKPRIDCEAARLALKNGLTPASHTLTVSVTGEGRVTGPGIDCPGQCSATVTSGTDVVLTAAAQSGWNFWGWRQDCAGDQGCAFTVAGNASIEALFLNAPQTVQFGAATASVTEGTATVSLPVTRSSGVGAAYVSVLTTSGAGVASASRAGAASAGAASGQDFKSVNTTVSFKAGETTRNVQISIIDDALYEPTEAFGVQLRAPSPTMLLGPLASATVTIADNGDRHLEFETVEYAVNEDEGAVTLQVRRHGDTSQAATVAYRTKDGSARYGRDYLSQSGTLSWAPGDTTPKAITVPIVDNISAEPLESFTVILQYPTGAALGVRRTAAVLITDED